MFFPFHLKKKFSINKTISELINEKGNHISEQSKIIFEQEQYYKKLYSSNHLCVDNEFASFPILMPIGPRSKKETLYYILPLIF
jgi:hypothetical protein